jgi:hypothetical protein
MWPQQRLLRPSNVPLTVMELAVLLAAGLRDWIDFGVIVRSHPGAAFLLG